MKIIKNLLNIIGASLISLSCSSQYYNESYSNLIPYKIGKEEFYLFKNSQNKFIYALEFFYGTQKEARIYKINFIRKDSIEIEKSPIFLLVDNVDNDEYDFGLTRTAKGEYDTVKPSLIYLKLISN